MEGKSAILDLEEIQRREGTLLNICFPFGLWLNSWISFWCINVCKPVNMEDFTFTVIVGLSFRFYLEDVLVVA